MTKGCEKPILTSFVADDYVVVIDTFIYSIN